jgi:hypothetical protein
MKQIVNALLLLAVASSISGCASISSLWSSEPEVKPIEIVTKPVEKTPLSLKEPEPLKLPIVKWIVITKENAPQIFAELEKKGDDAVIFGMTDDAYKDLSIMFSEIRNFISSQQVIILKYKDYYEPQSPKESDKK